MATVQIAPDDLLEVPDDWDSHQITNHIREVRPGLFVDTNLTYNPPARQTAPTAGQIKFAQEREAALSEQKQIDSILERLGNTGDAGVMERAGELLIRGTGNMVSGAGSLARMPIEVAQELLPSGISRTLGTLWQASSLGRLSDAGRAADELNDLIPSRAPSFGEARTLASNSRGLEKVMPFIEMAAQALGENAPQLAASVATAGIGGLQSLSPAVRAGLASFLTALPQEAGGIYQGMRDKGIAPTKAAAITGIAGPAAAALEAVSDIPLVGRMLGEGTRSLRKLPGRAARQSLLEGGTEVGQELAAIGAETAAGKPPSKDEIIERVGSSLVGGIGAGGGASTIVDVGRRVIEGPDKAQPPTIKPHKFVEIAGKYGVTPDQIEVVPQKITPDELKAIGHEGDVQAYVTPEGKIRVFEPSVGSDKEFDQIVREEVAHKRLATPEGKQAVSSFAESNPLNETELDKLRAYTRAEGETELDHRRRLTDEFLAKLDRDSWWTKFLDRFKAAVKPIVGVPLNNREAGRALLRNMSPRQVQQPQVAPMGIPAPASRKLNPVSDLVASLGWQRVAELVDEWEQGAELADDGKYIKNAVDPRSSLRKTKIDPSDFLEWYKSNQGGQQPVAPASKSESEIELLQQQLDRLPDGSGQAESILAQIQEIQSKKKSGRDYSEPIDILSYGSFGELNSAAFTGPDLELLRALRSTGVNPRIVSDDALEVNLGRRPAVYDPNSNAIIISRDWHDNRNKPNFSRRLLLHEAVHAATYQAIRDPKNSAKTQRLTQLMAVAAQKWSFSNKDGITESRRATIEHAFDNLDEFVAAGLTDFKFQRFLDSIKTTNRHRIGETRKFSGSLLKKFFASIANLLGFRDGTVLSEVLTLSSDLIEGKPDGLTETPRQPVAPASIGTAASSRRSVQITEKVVRDFPGLRVVYNDPPADDTGEAVQVGPDGTVHVNPKKAEPRSVRRQIIEAAVKSGTMMLRDADRDSVFSVMAQARPKEVANEARRIGADVNTGEGRMKVLANLLANRSPKSPFMRRLMTRMQLPKEDAKLVERAVDVALDRFRSAEPMRFGEVDSDQIYADDNAPTYGLKPLLQALREIAKTIEVRSLARKQFKVVDDHVNQLLQAARARILANPDLAPTDDNGEPVAINPADNNFLDLIQQVGVPISQQDGYIHHVYRTELVARQLLNIDRKLSRLGGIKSNLESAVAQLDLKTYSPEQIDTEIAELEAARAKLLERAEETFLDSGEIEARASEIRESDEAVPEAAAARRVMENPKVAEFAAIIDRIDDSGRTPRPVSDLTEFHASGVEVKHGVQRAAYRALSDAVKEARSKYLHGEYARQLTSLRKQWSAARAKSGAVEIEIHDVIQSLTRTLGLSGSLQGREAATLLRDQQSAIASFAVRLADAAPDTPAGRLREAIIALPSNGTLQPSTEIRTLAAQSGVSEDLLTSVLKYIRDVPEFHNAVVTLFERASARVHQATVTAIERIENALDDETKEGDALANRIADEQLSRLRDRNRNLTSRANSIESQLAKLEDERLYWEKFGEFTSVEMPDAKGDRRMFHPIENGHLFVSFTHPEGEQPEITIKAGDLYTQNTLRRLLEWQQNAAAAIAGHTTDEQTRRGLIAAQQGLSEFIDASFTQDQIVRAMAPGKLMGALDKLFTRTAENLAKYVPGFFGDRVRKTAAAYDNTGGKIERLKTKHVSTFNKMFRRAGESLGLNLRVPGESARLGAAYNEVAHRLRQNGSGVAEGDTLLWDTVRGKQVTPELLNLIRYTRSMGREGQLILEKTLYGGVRVDLPGGRQIVRPPAETGDLGLGRLSNKAKTIRLADIYRAAVDANGKTQGVAPDAPQVIDFWDQDPDALLSSIDDMNRSDIGIEVDPMLRKIAAIAMRGIRQRGDTVPNTIDEWVDRLFGIADPGIPDRGGQTVRPAGGKPEIRTKFLAHLAQYGRVAAAKHPPGSKAPVHGSGVIVGEDDRTEFSSPAAPLMYPGSYYEYGSASGLSSFLGRVADLAQVDYLAALNAAAAHLRARIFAMQEAIKGDLTPFKEEILYHTTDLLSGQEIDKQRAELAIERMKQHADRIEREVAGIEQGSPSIKLISKVVATFAAWILAGPRAMMTNVLSGPIGAHQLNKQVFGVWRGTLQTLNNFIYASPHFAYDMVSALARTVIREDMLPLFLRQHEMRDYLESDGIGGSYDREELKQVDSFADGFSEKSAGERLYAANQAAARNVQDVIGVRLGDRSLNRFAVRFVIPGIIRQLNRIASEYAGRLAALGVEGPDVTRPETLLSADDSRHVLGAREFLAEFGNPEEILLRLHRGEVDTRRFFRSELGKKIGTSILYRFNPASRTNRPMSNDMVLFLGWTSHQMQMKAASYRNPVEASRSQKVWHTMNSLASDALVGLVAAYTSMAIGGTLLGGAAASLRAIGKLLSGDPPPEDEGGLWSWLEHKLAYMVGLLKKVPILGFGVSTASRVFDATGKALTPAAKLTPDKAGFWDRPIADIAIDMAKAAPSAYGLSADSSRIPFVSMLEQGGSGAYQAMRGAGQYVAGWGDPGAEAGAKADIKAGIRTTMGMYGFAGQTLSDLLMPGGTEDRVVANAIKNAAHEEGVRIEPFTFNQQSFAAPTPIRKSLMEAGRKLAAGDQAAATEIDGIAKFVYDRAYNRTINNGGTEEDAAKAGDSAVKSALRGLNPYEHAIGHTLTEEQYAALQKRLAGRPEVARDEQAANAVIDRISQSPPSGDPFNPSESMRSPVKVQPAPKRRGGKPRRSIRATRVSRRTLGRKLRFARSIA